MSAIIWEYQVEIKNPPSKWNEPTLLWIPIKALYIEQCYQEWLLSGQETGRVYHCFGDGITTCVRFSSMEAFCSSTKCSFDHQKGHNEFKIRRRIKKVNPEETERNFTPIIFGIILVLRLLIFLIFSR